MEIHDGQKTKRYFTLAITALVIVGLSYFILAYFQSTPNQNKNEGTGAELDINLPTQIPRLSYIKIINNTKFSIYTDEQVSIYLVKDTYGNNKLLYVYPEKPEGRVLTDLFFVHVYLENQSKMKEGVPFLNLDFWSDPNTVDVNGNIYYIFERELVDEAYSDDGKIPLDHIAYINTGRFKPNEGRSLSVEKIKLDKLEPLQLKGTLDEITISINSNGYDKLKNKRDEALKYGILISEEDDIIKGQICYNNNPFLDADMRLKGDWTDHLKHQNKWSYRVMMDDGETLQGMRKFSIQHPKVRNYAWEWLFNKSVKNEGIIGLRYGFASVSMIIKDGTSKEIDMGIMAVEEAFDKILIENNKKREGILLGFDESILWKDRKKTRKLNLPISSRSENLQDFKNAPIKVFNENKILSDVGLTKQLKAARNLIDGWRSGAFKISEVFDVDLLTTFVALSNLYGGNHGLIWHNVRIYYNPITQKLEPVSFDSNSGMVLKRLHQYPLSENDQFFQEKLREKLKVVSSNSYVNGMMDKFSSEFEIIRKNLREEYRDTFDPTILEQNSNFIKKVLNPAILVKAGLFSYDANNMVVEISNVSDLPVSVSKLIDIDGRSLGYLDSKETFRSGETRKVAFSLSNYFVNAFVSKKNKKGTFHYPKDLEKLRILHNIKGVNVKRKAAIKPIASNPNLNEQVKEYKLSKSANYSEFAFINQVSDSILIIGSGKYKLDRNLIIPSNFSVKFLEGVEIDLINNAHINSQSALLFSGTKKNPVKLYSSDGTGQGIFVSGADKLSVIEYTEFNNLSNPQAELWSVSGAVNFHESDVRISHCFFTNNRCEDALNIIRSEFTMSDVVFENAMSDSFDGDFVTGTLTRCTFIDSGNDGIDVSGSQLVLEDIKVRNPSDKGISAGENSQISGKNIEITGGEIGVVSKDLSTINLSDLRIINTRLGLSAFQKKSEYGVASIDISELKLQDVAVEHLIEVNSSLTIDNKAVETVSNNVIDQMYGKEYGKSSR